MVRRQPSLLRPLISSKQYNVAAVWLQYGECLAAMDQMEEAAEAYGQVNKRLECILSGTLATFFFFLLSHHLTLTFASFS